MIINKKREVLDMLVTLYNERSFLEAAAKKNDLMAISYTNRTMARDLLDIIIKLADGELVDIKYEHRFVVRAGIEYDAIEAEWA